jgi:hypothetical protein
MRNHPAELSFRPHLYKLTALFSPTQWIFILFGAVMLLQQSYTYLYHDDYGYASLTYAVSPSSPVQAGQFSLFQLGEYLWKHYLSWGGRVLFFGIEILLLRGGLWPYRLAQAGTLAGILALSHLLIQRESPTRSQPHLPALLLCSFFGLISLEVHRNGTYWASAASTYVWPFAALFAAAVLHHRLAGERPNRPAVLLLGLLYFAAGWSQEQVGLVSLFLGAGLFLRNRLEGRRSLLGADTFLLLCALAGYLILMLAPGNQARLDSYIYASFQSLSLAGKIKHNLPAVLSMIVGKHNQALLLLWSLAGALWMLHAYRTIRTWRGLHLSLALLNLLYASLLALAFLPGLAEPAARLYLPGWNSVYLLFWSVFLGAAALATTLFCLHKRAIVLLSIFAGALLSQVALLVSPSLNIRSTLVFLFTFFPVLAAMLADIYEQKRPPAVLARAGLLLLLTAAVFNQGFILQGYAANSPVMHANNQALLSAARAVSQGQSVQPVELSRLPDERFAGEMPYNPGYSYINIWIKLYYNLPEEIELVWR